MFSQTPVFTNNIGRQGAFKKETRAKTMLIGKGSDICAGSFFTAWWRGGRSKPVHSTDESEVIWWKWKWSHMMARFSIVSMLAQDDQRCFVGNILVVSKLLRFLQCIDCYDAFIMVNTQQPTHSGDLFPCLCWAPCHPQEKPEKKSGDRSLRGSFFQSWSSSSGTLW